MPYKTKGKCVYKKDTGNKVGCTEGPVKDYLGALHANVKKESFDSLINQYLSKYLFEDAMASTAVSPTQPAKSNDPQVQNLKKARANKLKELQTKLNRPPTQQEVDAFTAGQQSVN
jgi:hypothetical protein